LRLLSIVLSSIALCLSVALLASCGGGGEEDPQQVLDSVSFEGVESAAFSISLGIESAGKQGGNLDVDVSGWAESEGIEATATVTGSAEGKPVDFEGGLTLLENRGFVEYQGTEYEIDPNNYSIAKPLFFPALTEEGGAEIDACLQSATDIEAGDLVEGLQNDGSVEVDGVETTKVSGELDVPAAIDAALELSGDLNCRGQVEALSPSPQYKLRLLGDELAAVAGAAQVAIYVDDEGVVRRFTTTFTADPKGSREPVKVDFDFSLSEINANRKIESPSGAKPIFALLGKLGVSPFEFLNWTRGGEGVQVLAEKVGADVLP
jgi:hypothetical protein